MVYNRKRRGVLGAAFPPVVKNTTFPSPSGGINAMDSFSNMPPTDCIYTYNMMPSEYGMELREGYREWANNVGGGVQVRSLVPFEGQMEDNSTDRMFAVCESGIYDVSTYGDVAPVQSVAFASTGVYAGHGVSCQITNDASAHYLFYADGENGLYRYDEASDAWAAAPGITGVAAADIAFVNIHKQRIWLVERDSDDAWYLPVDAIAGAAVKFTFGSKFVHGGYLAGLWSWTVDGGDGVDDYFVAVSSAGDVLVYRGGDPSGADWALVGSYYIGDVPKTRKLGLEYGPDLYLLSTYGVTSVRDMLMGASVFDFAKSPTAKITRLLQQDLKAKRQLPAWGLSAHPGDNFVQIIVPKSENYPAVQYTQNTTTKAWGMWRGVPVTCAKSWVGRYLFGTDDGRIFWYSGNRDGTLLDGTLGQPIEFSLLTSFNHLDDPSVHKIVNMVRTVGLMGGAVTTTTRVLYDYDVKSIPYQPGPPDPNLGPVWDAAIWDVSVWDSPLTGSSTIIGAAGMGRVAAIALRGYATIRAYLIQFDINFKVGGFL